MIMCRVINFFFFFKQKTAYEMRISDWSSDVCSSDLVCSIDRHLPGARVSGGLLPGPHCVGSMEIRVLHHDRAAIADGQCGAHVGLDAGSGGQGAAVDCGGISRLVDGQGDV